jgi:hypothetical protein
MQNEPVFVDDDAVSSTKTPAKASLPFNSPTQIVILLVPVKSMAAVTMPSSTPSYSSQYSPPDERRIGFCAVVDCVR